LLFLLSLLMFLSVAVVSLLFVICVFLRLPHRAVHSLRKVRMRAPPVRTVSVDRITDLEVDWRWHTAERGTRRLQKKSKKLRVRNEIAPRLGTLRNDNVLNSQSP